MSGTYTGIGQGVLRLRAPSSDLFKRQSLRRAYHAVSRLYPEQTLYVTLTANVILRSTQIASSYSVYFGQSFGSAKSLFYGQEHDPESGDLTRLYSEFAVSSADDLQELPIHFTTEDFAGIYKRNFASSNVVVHSVISLVYFFSVGLENYQAQRQLERTPLRLF